MILSNQELIFRLVALSLSTVLLLSMGLLRIKAGRSLGATGAALAVAGLALTLAGLLGSENTVQLLIGIGVVIGVVFFLALAGVL